MIAMFGVGPLEMVILAGLFCIVPAVIGIIVAVIVMMNRKGGNAADDQFARLEAENRQLREQLARQDLAYKQSKEPPGA